MLTKCSRLLNLTEKILARAKAKLIKEMETSDLAQSDWQKQNQLLLHGLAWQATYVESLKQLLNWARILNATDRMGEFEFIALEVAFAEYSNQIIHGIW